MSISINDPCPSFHLPITPGQTLANTDLVGKATVLFLYPKDNTPTCTNEVLAFAAAVPQFAAQNCRVIGCSADSIAAHQKFQTKLGVTLPLISDPDHVLIGPLGAWVEKQLYGRTYMGIDRCTFVFDDQMRLREMWRKVRVKGHVDTVLTAVNSL